MGAAVRRPRGGVLKGGRIVLARFLLTALPLTQREDREGLPKGSESSEWPRWPPCCPHVLMTGGLCRYRVASKWTEAETGFMGKDRVAAAGEAVTGPSAALRPVSRAPRGLHGAPACPELGGRFSSAWGTRE